MKKKIGEINNKPVVIGNSNEFTKNEIGFKDLVSNSKDHLDDVFSAYVLRNSKAEEYYTNQVYDSIFDKYKPCVSRLNLGNVLVNWCYTIPRNSNVGMFLYFNKYAEEIDLFTIEEYFIKVSAKSALGLDKNKPVIYEFSHERSQWKKDITKILDAFPITEEEYYIPDGIILSTRTAGDDWGFVIAAKKIDGEYYLKEVRNTQINFYHINDF